MEITDNYDVKELREFYSLIQNHWPEVTISQHHEIKPEVPKPIIAKEGHTVVGGLSYIWYERPGQHDLALWINTVFVIATHRSKGIGRELIKFAMEEQSNGQELYVYTTIPDLYVKLAWLPVSHENENHVLKYTRLDV